MEYGIHFVGESHCVPLKHLGTVFSQATYGIIGYVTIGPGHRAPALFESHEIAAGCSEVQYFEIWCALSDFTVFGIHP
jgi:hypothetical protein